MALSNFPQRNVLMLSLWSRHEKNVFVMAFWSWAPHQDIFHGLPVFGFLRSFSSWFFRCGAEDEIFVLSSPMTKLWFVGAWDQIIFIVDSCFAENICLAVSVLCSCQRSSWHHCWAVRQTQGVLMAFWCCAWGECLKIGVVDLCPTQRYLGLHFAIVLKAKTLGMAFWTCASHKGIRNGSVVLHSDKAMLPRRVAYDKWSADTRSNHVRYSSLIQTMVWCISWRTLHMSCRHTQEKHLVQFSDTSWGVSDGCGDAYLTSVSSWLCKMFDNDDVRPGIFLYWIVINAWPRTLGCILKDVLFKTDWILQPHSWCVNDMPSSHRRISEDTLKQPTPIWSYSHLSRFWSLPEIFGAVFKKNLQESSVLGPWCIRTGRSCIPDIL